MVVKIPESGLAKVKSGTHKPLLLTGATVPEDGQRPHNRQLTAGRLSARGIECDAEDLDYEMVVGSHDREHIVRVAARLAPDVGGDELKAVVGGAASSRKVPYQMDEIGGYSFNPVLSYGTNRFSTTVECSERQVGSFSNCAAQRAAPLHSPQSTSAAAQRAWHG